MEAAKPQKSHTDAFDMRAWRLRFFPVRSAGACDCFCCCWAEWMRQTDGERGWPVHPTKQGFPATQRETRGSPALCVSGSFEGNQRVFGAPFCFSRVSLGKLASFPESESWSGAKSGAKLRKSARYPGIFQVYRGFPGIPAKYPVFCRFWP